MVKFENDILTSMVKSLPASGVLQLRIVHAPAPVESKVDEVPYFPAILLCIDANSEYLFPVFCGDDFEKSPVLMLMELAEIFVGMPVNLKEYKWKMLKPKHFWKISVANATLFLPANKICHYLMRLGLLFWTVL